MPVRTLEHSPQQLPVASALSVNEAESSPGFDTQSGATGALSYARLPSRQVVGRLNGVNGVTLVDRGASDGAAVYQASAESGSTGSEPAALQPLNARVDGLPEGTSARTRWLKNLLDDVRVQWPVPPLFSRRLNKQLIKHRQILTQAWSPATIYPHLEMPLRPDASVSTGQCGVSSAWLLRRMSWSLRFRASYCIGDVLFGEDEHDDAKFHCWVEIGNASSARRLVIDLTCDQFEKFRNTPVLCEPYLNLVDQSIQYKAASRMRFKDLRKDSVWDRFKVLDEATSRAWLKALRGFPRKVMADDARR
jgi:hypothetical protein